MGKGHIKLIGPFSFFHSGSRILCIVVSKHFSGITIRICKDRYILKQYLSSREAEVNIYAFRIGMALVVDYRRSGDCFYPVQNKFYEMVEQTPGGAEKLSKNRWGDEK